MNSRRGLKDRKRIISQLIERDDGRVCFYCSRDLPAKGQGLQIEHMISVANGGSDDLDNLVLSCKACNRRKGKKDIKLFLEQEVIRLSKHLETILKRIEERCPELQNN